jgi:transcriptional regulator with XRE-family HTH domain
MDAGLTQEELAERAGVGWQHIHRIEYGYTDASGATLLRIAHAVRVPLRDLVG